MRRWLEVGTILNFTGLRNGQIAQNLTSTTALDDGSARFSCTSDHYCPELNSHSFAVVLGAGADVNVTD